MVLNLLVVMILEWNGIFLLHNEAICVLLVKRQMGLATSHLYTQIILLLY